MWSFDHPPLVRNTEKIRANTFAVLAVNGTSIVAFRERSKQEDIREVLREYRRANPDRRFVIVLDNFSSHHAIVVRQYAAGNNIRLVHLPPYSILAGSQSHRAGLGGDQAGGLGDVRHGL